MEFKEKLKEMLISREKQLEEFFNKNELEQGNEELDEFKTGATSEENGLNDFEQLLQENGDMSAGSDSDSEFSNGSGEGEGHRDWEKGASQDGTSEISTPAVLPEEAEEKSEESPFKSDESSSESQDMDEDEVKENAEGEKAGEEGN